MRLEKIEISGFKSFADKTTIEFDKGVTAVVGPNGSGKSNLSEAIKWVLGEQSAKSLRGKRMDDVIFAGSESRKAVNIAEVNLFIDNQDATLGADQPQVILTRRLNRNGDSDFFINKKPCRLKDITNLMMDSGLGKDSFALISQGKVEKIFNDKPEERRMIIEEAAGVLKYKDRKQQAQRKLDQTQDHLNRVEDILHEINAQLLPLEEQREQAIDYLAKKEQLTNIETALLAVEIETLNAQWKVALEEVEQYKKEIDRITNVQQDLEQDLNDQYSENSKQDQQLNELQQQFVSLVQKVEQLDGERKIIQQRQQFLKQNDEENQLDLAETTRDQERLESLLVEQQRTLQEKVASEQMAQRNWQQIVDELDQLTHTSGEQLKEMQSRYIDLLQAESRLKNQEQQLERSLATNEQIQARLNDEKGTLETQLKQTTDAISEQSLQKSTNEESLRRQEEQIEQERIVVQELQQQLREKSEQVERERNHVQQIQANYRSLKQVTEDYAGYFQGVRQVLTHKEQLTGVIGSVAELIRVQEPYTLALEIALGANSQYIVVADERAAAHAIQFLKQGRFGRATFLPLTVIKPRLLPETLRDNITKMDGFVGIASQLVQTNSDYQNIVDNLLGTTIVTSSLQSAQSIAKNIHYRYRVVSIEGDIINAGGSMTGGATKAAQNQSLVRRTTQLQQLKKELGNKEQALAQAQTAFEAIEIEYQTANKQFTALQEQKTKIDQLLQALTLQINYTVDQKAALNKQLQTVEIEREQAIEEFETLEIEYIANHQELTETVQVVKTVKHEIDIAQLSQEDRTATMQTLQAELQEASAKKATTIEQAAQAKKDLHTLEIQLKRVQERMELLNSKQSNQLQDQELDQQKLIQIEQQFAKQSQQLTQSERMLSEAKATKAALEESLKTNELKKNHFIQQLQKLFQEQAKAETKANRYELSIDQKLTYLSEEYELTYERAIEKADLAVSIEEASQQVRQLKRAIEQMGAINLMAIDEYTKVYERHEFLGKQQADLLEAKSILENTIDEMDDEVKKRFKETFDAIQYQFERTFPRLFGGGKATLSLTQPNDLLETGIDIVAQPPGKKLQSLSLLSGGERAFTAIALLFAILEVKPVPFCLLDEVEAALDEANVSRYGRYLKEFTQATQFIVITHRRGTMEEADVLYGVTMQDSGVSRLASVKFEDFEEESS